MGHNEYRTPLLVGMVLERQLSRNRNKKGFLWSKQSDET